MLYRINPKNGEKISALAFGCMRFHKDFSEVERQIRYAIDQGVNYFDTAYIYPGSEETLGKILAKDNLREKVMIATKLPFYLVRKPDDFDKFFATQTNRLQTNMIDFYLIHSLPNLASWRKLVSKGVLAWIQAKKEAGAIRQIGFSFHGAQDEFAKILEDYDWDFCMIQYNYLDEYNQAGKSGLLLAAQKGIPVMIMEPLRGGTLVQNLAPKAKAAFDTAPVKRTPADWGLRWVWNHPQATTVLSGMNTQEMLEENIRLASEIQPNSLTNEELRLYQAACQEIRNATKVPCTGCAYCVPCPQGVDIPLCFASLNDVQLKGHRATQMWYAMMTLGRNASLCNQCGRCEKVCPQGIPIREKLVETTKALERFPFDLIRIFVKYIGKQKKKKNQ